MNNFKLDNFKLDHPDSELSFVELPKLECENLISKILTDNNIQEISDSTSFFAKINRRHKTPIEVAATEDNSIFKILLNQQILDTNEDVYVIWDVNEIDIFKLNELQKYWEYIWYPMSDEAVLLYGKTSHKILLICEFSPIYLIN